MTAILDRVLADLDSAGLDEDVEDVVLAACLGNDDLGALLGGKRPERPPATPPQGDAAGAYVKSITVSGFRGIGPVARLGLQPGPGLTLIVGRNGSGKSSFAEAAEFVFTGGSSRWKARSAIWAAGWRNLHQVDPASIQVEIAQDAVAGSTVVGTRWASGAALDDAVRYVKRPGAPEADFGSLGWDSALEVYRPFLSYAELGNAVTGNPSGLFDALHSILGLQVVQDALSETTQVRLDNSASARQFKADTARMIELAESAYDERAAVTAAELVKPTPNLVLLADLASGAETPPDGTMNRLRRIAATAFPSIQEVRAVGEELLGATEDVNALQTLAAERALRLAQILELSATEIEAAGGGKCPACGVTELTTHWPEEARRAAAALMQEAQSVTAARSRLQAVQARAGQLVMNSPPATDFATDYPAVASLLSAWHGIDPHADPLKAADRILTVGGETAQSVTAAQEEASERARALEDTWQPVAIALAEWIAKAESAARERALAAPIKKAEAWLKAEAQLLRDERMQPLAEESGRIWETLRQESNIDLGGITLTGTGNHRRVAIDVSVDGVEGAALGVMSQGELHALGLALFIPRATSPESPFRFLLIDDPVQAMDPAKVDGLAMVLADAGQSRQVVVFTHDNRLPEAIRRLQLPATIWEVVRKPGSEVELRKLGDPVDRYLDDAAALSKTTELSPEIRGPVVAGLARSALEAAAHAAYRRTKIAAGVPHADVEAAIETSTTTIQTLALGFYGDATQANKVFGRLNQMSPAHADAFRACKEAVHGGAFVSWTDQDLTSIVAKVRDITKKLQT